MKMDIALAISAFVLSPNAIAQNHDVPIGNDGDYDGYEAGAVAICSGSGYADYGFTSYEDCYDTYMTSAPFRSEGGSGGLWHFNGDRYVFCGRIGCF